jgi:hypothetical protein
MTHSKHIALLCSALVAVSSYACSGAGSDEGTPVAKDEATTGSTGSSSAADVQLTPEYVAEVRAQNAKALAAAGLFYTMQAGPDHDVMFLESPEGGFGVVERIGSTVEESTVKEDVLSKHLSPAEIFKHYKPDAEVPGVLLDATARLHPSAEQLAGMHEVPVEPTAMDDAVNDLGYSLLPGPGLAPQHTTSDGNHFQNDTHSYNGGATDTGCPTISGQTLKLCYLNRTSGGNAEKTSTHAVFHFGIYAGGSTLWGLKRNGSLQWEVTVMNGESWRTSQEGPWECPGIFCVYPGFTAVTWRSQWAGGGKSWHFGGTWSDFLRN